MLVVSSADNVQVWDTSGSGPTLLTDVATEWFSFPQSLLLLPDQDTLVVGTPHLQIGSVNARALTGIVTTLRGESSWSMAAAPDGSRAATCTSSGRLFVYDTSDWSLKVIQQAHDGLCNVTFTRSGERILTLGGAQTLGGGVLRVWRTSDVSLESALDLEDSGSLSSFRSSDGTDIAVVNHYGGTYLWRVP